MGIASRLRALVTDVAGSIERKPSRQQRLANIFELQPLEQRLFLSATLSALPPSQTFTNNLPDSHPMTQVDLSWTDGLSGSYDVMQSTDDVNFTKIATVGGPAGSYRVTGLTPGTWYFFELDGANDTSNQQSISTANTEAVYDEPDNDPNGGYTFPSGSTLGSADISNQKIFYQSDNGGTCTVDIPSVPPHGYTNVKVYFFGFGSTFSGGTVDMLVNGHSTDMVIAQGDSSEISGGTGGSNPEPFTRWSWSDNVPDSGAGNMQISWSAPGIQSPSAWGIGSIFVNVHAPQQPFPVCSCSLGGAANIAPDAQGGDPMGNDNFTPDSSSTASAASTDVQPADGSIDVNSTDLTGGAGLSQVRQWSSSSLSSSYGSVANNPTNLQPFLSQPEPGLTIVTDASHVQRWFNGGDTTSWVDLRRS